MFSPQSSVLVSLLSGFGLIGLVVLTPVKSPENIDILIPPKAETGTSTGLPFLERKPVETKASNETPDDFLDINIEKTKEPLSTESEPKIIFGDDSARSNKSLSEIDNYVLNFGDRKYYLQSKGLSLRGVQNTGMGSNTFAGSGSYEKSGFRKFDQFEMDYQITSHLGAVVTGSNLEIGGDRTQRMALNQTMAGVSVQAGQFFEAKLLAGDSSLQNVNTTNSNLNGLRQVEAVRRNVTDVRSLYEWQANFTPSEYFKVQTSIYNVRGENQNAVATPEGGKVSFLFGNQKLQLNIRYNYINARNQNGNIFYTGFVPSQDLASLGFVLFLDQSRNYSVYVGNQMFNVFNDPYNQIKDSSGRSPSTFSASFRGKNPSLSSTTFFLNFQNQFYKDGILLGVPGGNLNANVLNGKSFYEYATSLGLELAF